MQRLIKRQSKRLSCGQALVEGVVALWLIVGISVAALALLFNVGMLTYQQQKLDFICNQAAVFAAGQFDGNAEGLTPGFASALGQKMNLAINPGDVTVSRVKFAVPTLGNLPGFTVAIKTKAPLFFGIFGNVFPIHDSATVPVALSQVNGYSAIITFGDPTNKMLSYYVPAWHILNGPGLMTSAANGFPFATRPGKKGQAAVSVPWGMMHPEVSPSGLMAQRVLDAQDINGY